MKKRVFRWFVFLLGLLGISGCESNNGIGPAPEYGVPMATYKLDGKVVQAETREAIEGIEVRFDYETTRTNNEGSWYLPECLVFHCGDCCSLSVRDIDGYLNGGLFKEKKIPLDPRQTSQGSGDWDSGVFEQHDILIDMEENTSLAPPSH